MTKPEETTERTWYCTSVRDNSITPYQIVCESEDMVWAKSSPGQRSMAYRKHSKYYDFFTTIEEAQAFILKRAEEKLARAEAEVAERREKLVKLRGGA